MTFQGKENKPNVLSKIGVKCTKWNALFGIVCRVCASAGTTVIASTAFVAANDENDEGDDDNDNKDNYN